MVVGRHILVLLAAVAVAAGCTSGDEPAAVPEPGAGHRVAASEQGTAVTIRRSPSCGCCGEHIDYLRDAGFGG
jgi:hypothetical protein